MFRGAFLLLGAWLAGNSFGNPIVPLRVCVTDETGRSAFADVQGTVADDGAVWCTSGRISLRDSAGLLATVAPLGDEPLFQVSQTAVRFNFELVAGQTDTTFTISGALVSFPPIQDAHAAATAAVTLIDSAADGASFVGLLPGGAIGFEYNNAVPFGELIDRMDAQPGGSQFVTERLPEAGYAPLGAAAFSGRVFCSAELSAFDTARGEGEFTFVPEPDSILLLACTMLVARRLKSDHWIAICPPAPSRCNHAA